MEANIVKVNYESIFNNSKKLNLVASGRIDELNETEKNKTVMNTNIENIRRASSDKFKNITFDVRKGFDLDSFKEMLSEWSLEISDKYGIFNLNNICTDENGMECEICKSLNPKAKGNFSCKTAYKIKNSVNGNILKVGSVCINKFNITVIHEGKRVKPKDVVKILSEIDTTVQEYENDISFDIWRIANSSGIIVLRDFIINNKNNLSNKELNELRNILSKFKDGMEKMKNVLYTFFKEKRNASFDTSSAFSEAQIIQTKLYDMCRDSCDKGYYIFAPSPDFITNYSVKYSAFYIFTTSYVMSLYNYNTRNKKPIFEGINYNKIRDIRNQARLTANIKGIKSEIQTYMSYNSMRITKSHIMALLVMFGDEENKENLKTVIKSFNKPYFEIISTEFENMKKDIPEELMEDYFKMYEIIKEVKNIEKKTIRRTKYKKLNKINYN